MWMKVWKKKDKKGFKSHIAQDKHLNSVSLPIYRKLLSSFFLAPIEKHFLNFSFSLPYFSRCISSKLLPLSFFRTKLLVGYESDFSSHTRGCNSRKGSLSAVRILHTHLGCFILGTSWLIVCLHNFLAVPRNVLKKATLFVTQPLIFSVCHKLLLQQF